MHLYECVYAYASGYVMRLYECVHVYAGGYFVYVCMYTDAHSCMYIVIRIIPAYVCIYTRTHMHACMHVPGRLDFRNRVCLSVCLCAYKQSETTCQCVFRNCVDMYMCMYISKYACVCMHISIHTGTRRPRDQADF